MEVLLIPVILSVFTGILIGKLFTAYVYRQFHSRHSEVPLYEIVETISPAEFGYLLDGKAGKKEFISEIIQMVMQNKLEITLDDGKDIKIYQKNMHFKRTSLQNSIAKQFKIPGIVNFDAREGVVFYNLETEIEGRLRNKGLLRKENINTKLEMAVTKKHVIVFLVLFMVITLGLFVIAGIGHIEFALFFSLAFGLFITLLLYILYCLFYIARLFFSFNSQVARLKGDGLEDEWQKIQSLYIYLKTAGADTMYPEYESMNFSQVDKLYPYYVAAGLDKEVLKKF